MIKKVILSIAIVSAAALSSFAANDNKANTDNKARTECSKNSGECKKAKHGKGDKAGFGMRAFEGIDLTEAQKTQLEALRSDFKAKKEASMKERGDRKEKNDNLTAEQKQQLKAEKMAKRQQAQQEFNDKVKNILTPEQYTKYLDNTKKMASNKDKSMKKGGKHSKGQKGNHAKNGKKGQRKATKSQSNNYKQA